MASLSTPGPHSTGWSSIIKKKPSWERSKNASRRSGVLSWVGSGRACDIEFSPGPEDEAKEALHKSEWAPDDGGPGSLLRVCLLLDHDHARHERSVDPTLIGVRPGMLERHRIAGVGSVHDHTVEEDVRR